MLRLCRTLGRFNEEHQALQRPCHMMSAFEQTYLPSNDRFGSSSDLGPSPSEVSSSPNSGHPAAATACRFRARNGLAVWAFAPRTSLLCGIGAVAIETNSSFGRIL